MGEARRLAPYQNATGLQVTAAVLAGIVWAIENPRRGIVEAGLDLMRRCHLLEKVADEQGFTWRASEEAASYVELLESPYSADLKTCASWLAGQVRELSKSGFKSMVVSHIGEWTESFGHGSAQAGS